MIPIFNNYLKYKPGVTVADSYNSNIQEAEEKRACDQDHFELHSKFQASLFYTVMPHSK